MSRKGEKRLANFKLVLGVTGASGVIYALRLLELLKNRSIETHLVVSPAGARTLQEEMDLKLTDICSLADIFYRCSNVGAAIASGSFLHDGMVIAPCSMKTLAAVALGLDENLVSRAASVTLKERRKLVLLCRESPLTLAHLHNMTAVTQMGGVVMFPAPAFYTKPNSINDIVDYTLYRILDQFGFIAEYDYGRWFPEKIK